MTIKSWIRNIFARRTTLAERSAPRTDFALSDAGQWINDERSLTLSAVWSCIRVISESIAQLPWHMYQTTATGRELLPTHPAQRLLGVEPNSELTPAVWREVMGKDVLSWGNAYAEIERDNSNRPLALWRIPPDRVETIRTTAGKYHIVRGYGEPVPIPDADMYHVRGPGDDLAGWSMIRFAAHSLGLALAENETVSSFTKNDARPLGMLTALGNVPKEARQTIENAFTELAGGKNKGRTVVIPHNMQYTPLGLPNNDAQLLESRRFSILEVCRWYRVPPHKIAELQYATFSNITHQSMEFVQDSLMPWIVKFEQEANRKLVSSAARGRVYSKINVNGLLRGDFETRTQAYQLMLDRGVFSINDVLELEDRNTVPGGDARFVPLNMQTLEQAQAEPEPVPEPLAGPPAGELEAEEDDLAQRVRPAVRDAVARIVNRQTSGLAGKVTSAKIRRHLGDALANYATQQLSPLVPLLESVTGHTYEQLPAILAAYARSVEAEAEDHFRTGGELEEIAQRWRESIDRITTEIMGENPCAPAN